MTSLSETQMVVNSVDLVDLTKEQKVANHFDEEMEVYIENYSAGSPLTDYFRQRLKIVYQFLKNYDKATILDLGCGPGMMVDYCAERGFEFFGVDISDRMINECIKRFGHLDSVHFSVGKLQSLDFADSSFDVILCMGALEYVNEDEVDKALLEMLRVLKPGGIIILSLLNKNSFRWQYKTLPNMIKTIFNKSDQPEPDLEELHQTFAANSFHSTLQAHQFANIETVFFGMNLFNLEGGFLPNKVANVIKKGLERFLGNQLRWMCTAFIIKAQKK